MTPEQTAYLTKILQSLDSRLAEAETEIKGALTELMNEGITVQDIKTAIESISFTYWPTKEFIGNLLEDLMPKAPVVASLVQKKAAFYGGFKKDKQVKTKLF